MEGQRRERSTFQLNSHVMVPMGSSCGEKTVRMSLPASAVNCWGRMLALPTGSQPPEPAAENRSTVKA